MSERLGLVTYEPSHRPMFPPEGYAGDKTCSETRATQIDEEISRVVEEAHVRVQQILTEKRNILNELAALLSKNEMVQGEELRKMMAESKA